MLLSTEVFPDKPPRLALEALTVPVAAEEPDRVEEPLVRLSCCTLPEDRVLLELPVEPEDRTLLPEVEPEDRTLEELLPEDRVLLPVVLRLRLSCWVVVPLERLLPEVPEDRVLLEVLLPEDRVVVPELLRLRLSCCVAVVPVVLRLLLSCCETVPLERVLPEVPEERLTLEEEEPEDRVVDPLC